ncbi:MAG: ribosome small subunit-dependent GTPase A [Anaerolineae bacterium]|nr:ribosome small subunit-dependent GTPase A [Anaerolineae bacterium]
MPEAGLVVKEQSGFFWVEVADGTIYMCRLRGRLLEEAQSSDVAAIGDRVTITILHDDEDGDKGVIESVEDRHTVLSRAVRTEGNRGGGEPLREQVIIANADQAIFVLAAAQPSPDLMMLDRLLAAAEKAELDSVIVVNKVDLEDPREIATKFAPYERMNYTVLYTSAFLNTGIQELQNILKDKISTCTGPSGVGKSSLLNRIQPNLARSVKQVSGYAQEGVHTTRDSLLVKLDVGGYLADTPGMRYLTLWDVEPEELDAYFVDFGPYIVKCRFGDCAHRDEPGCAVRKAVKEGAISVKRYKHYLNLRAELDEIYAIY